MSLSNYGELKTAVANWLHRSDLTAVIPDMILMGEARLNRELRLQDMIATETGNLSTSGSTLALPERYLDKVQFRLDSRLVELVYVVPESLADYTGETLQTRKPEHYTITNQIELDALPDADYAYTLKFFKGYRLTSDSETNYLLTTYPQAYLYAAKVHAGIYTLDDQAASNAEGLLQAELASIKKAEARRSGAQMARLVVAPINRVYNINEG